MLRFREHRGSLEDSLRTAVDLKNRAALVAHIAGLLRPFREVTDADIRIEPYKYDERIDWMTWIVSVRNFGVVGFATLIAGGEGLNTRNCAAFIATTVGEI
jgi:hypothetical protein